MKKLWIAFVTVGMLFSGCSNQNVKETVELIKPVSLTVDTAVVSRHTIDSMSQYNAYVVPYTKELSFTVSGTMDFIKVSIGEQVKKGQILAALDESGLWEQINALEESIARVKQNNYFSNTTARYDIDLMKLELNRLQQENQKTDDPKALADRKLSINIKEADIKIAETRLSQAKELQELELKRQEQDLEALSQNAGRNTITAPFSGEIVYVTEAVPNSRIEVGHTVLVIADNSKLHLESDYISENTLKNSCRYYAFLNNKKYNLTYVPMDMNEYLKIALSGGTPKTSFSLEDKIKELSAGDYVSIRVINKYKQEVLTVPSKSIYADAEGRYVYLMNGSEKVRQTVEIGISADNEVEVTNGVEEGDVVYVGN